MVNHSETHWLEKETNSLGANKVGENEVPGTDVFNEVIKCIQ